VCGGGGGAWVRLAPTPRETAYRTREVQSPRGAERLERQAEKSFPLDTKIPLRSVGSPRGWSGRADNGSVDIVGDYRARLLHEQGMPFREIAERTGTSLTRVRAALRTAAPGRMRREIRAEIRGAGGLSAWWRQ